MKIQQLLTTFGCAFAVTTYCTASPLPLIYNEITDGELSANGTAPTFLNFAAGLNCVSGTMGVGAVTAGVVDADIFTFTVESGFTIDSLLLKTYTPAGGPGTGSFLAIAAGDSIKMNSGLTHLSNMLVGKGGELLDILSSTKRYSGGFNSPAGASGLTSPIGEGTYTLWFQEAQNTTVDYELCFNLTPVPEPTTLALASLGLGAVLLFRRKR